jgi:hypothetical protein
MNASQTMAGRQFIAGRRVASGEATLLSLRAVDGEATGHRFYPASREEAAQAAEARSRRLPFIHKPRRSSGRAFSAPLPMNWTRWAKRFLHSPNRRPRCRWRGCRASGRAPAASCGCLLA